MKRLLIAAAFGLTAIAAQAQTTTTTTTTTVDDPTSNTIRTYVTREKTTSIPAPDGYTVTIGEPLPAPVPLYRLPDDVGPYQYTVMDGHTVLVDENRNVVKVID